MARQGGVSQWPRAGEMNVPGTLEYETSARDSMGGSTSASWVEIGPWHVSSKSIPVVVSETEATSVYELEGWYRADLWTLAQGGKTIRFSIPSRSLVLKFLQVENPELKNRTLKATCARMVGTA